MLKYTIQRIFLATAICLLAAVVLFSVVRVIPGDPATIALGSAATPEMRAEFRARMGLDQPFPNQLAIFFVNAAKGDLGQDLWSRRSVISIIGENLPYTLSLIAVSLGWSCALGIFLGCYSASHRGGTIDRIAGVLSVGAISLPSFVVSIYGVLIFAVSLKWLPALGAGEPGDLADRLYHLILPALAIGLGWVGYVSRFVRASMLEVMNENYVRTARAFGLEERTIIFRYSLRVAILPTITMLGMSIGSLLTGAVFAEVIFSRPGIGKLIYDSAATRNIPVIIGAVMTTVFIANLSTIISDLIVALLSPSVRRNFR